MLRRAVSAAVTAVALCACQGGGASPPAFGTGSAAPRSVTQSQALAAAGGSVTATLGAQSVTVVVPSGALSGPATVSLTVYGPFAGPKSLSERGRRPRSVGKDAVLVAEFAVAVVGATLVKPLKASLNAPNAGAGSVFRLAGFGTSFDDVDTVTWSGGTAASDLNAAFARMSLAAPAGTLYAFYTEPQSEAGAAPAPLVTVATTSANPIGAFGSATFTAGEADANGFPFLDASFTFALDNPALGTIDPASGVLTAGAIDSAGNVVATDNTATRNAPHGKAAVVVSSQRPGNAGDSFTFTGTLSSTTQQTNSNVVTQPQTDTATVSVTSTVQSFTPGAGGGGRSVVHSDEVDTYALRTVTTHTDSTYSFAAAGASAQLSILASDAKDSGGTEDVTQYGAGNGLLDVLPETPGAFGPNTAALTYTEIDPANFSRARTVAADGSYVEQGTDSLGDVQTITTNSDLSAFYDATQYSGFNFTATAPAGVPPTITVTLMAGSTPRGSLTIPSWIPPASAQPSAETDVDNGRTAFPPSCNVPAKYGTSGNQLVATIHRVDPALGNAETETTTTYLAPGVGPVCIQLSDAVSTFYDYTLQNGSILFVSGDAKPIQLTSVTESLTLQSASTSGGAVTSGARRAASSATIRPGAFAAAAFARARFEHVVREKLGGTRRATFSRDFLNHGVQVR